MNNEQLTLECPGAGQLFIGTSPHVKCGHRVGFEIGVSWGIYGRAGGVLPRREAERLLKMLHEQLKDITETEEEEYSKHHSDMIT